MSSALAAISAASWFLKECVNVTATSAIKSAGDPDERSRSLEEMGRISIFRNVDHDESVAGPPAFEFLWQLEPPPQLPLFDSLCVIRI
ncbi:MAG: hypothetical protein ACI9VS_000096 [Candidatus Binatia bacterium]|jgi:hypothetical protein